MKSAGAQYSRLIIVRIREVGDGQDWYGETARRLIVIGYFEKLWGPFEVLLNPMDQERIGIRHAIREVNIL